MSRVINWSQEIIDAGTRLWLDGKSAAEVAHVLSHQFDCTITKNAWLGKFDRLAKEGFVARRYDYKPVARDLKSSTKNSTGKKLRLPSIKLADSAQKANIFKLVTPPKPVSRSGFVTIDRATGCLYAVTSTPKGVHLFCNKKKAGNSQYCQEHHDMCHVKATFPIKKILRVVR